MGISVEPVEGTDESQPIEIEDQDENSQSGAVVQSMDSTNQSEGLFKINSAAGDSFIDNELLMETDGTVIDNL